VAAHEAEQPTVAFHSPDVLIQVVDATALQRDLELTLELTLLGRPLVIALNRVDEARRKGLYINTGALSDRLGVPVVATVAHMGIWGSRSCFALPWGQRETGPCRSPSRPSEYIDEALKPLRALVARPEIGDAFQVPWRFLLMQLAENNDYFLQELGCHLPQTAARGARRAPRCRALPAPPAVRRTARRPASSGGIALRET
jgi:ferrous iron transport protein B